MPEMGKLYLVSTPIGNLGDITLRALETLKAVDYVASEDTRRTGLLLKHFDIKKPQVSFHEHNEQRVIGRIIGLLREGKSVAVVTSAGTPSISDPGFVALWEAVKEGLEVTAIPGATAFVPALVLSGMPVYSFTFRGFPPHKPGKRRKFLEMDRDSPHTLIYYESPYRLRKFLTEAMEVFGNRHAAVCKELTKLFERVTRGRLSQLLDDLEENPKGEYVIVIAGAEIGGNRDDEPDV
ncbi:MAG: 16S rRNA (cytidine(1402)-2'-O)-methyltransferase [Sedimentisphaerales bacterium]|jgi:16S rRNA (cytidine1402-2'-O)-methyltransferase|nr:16S rRNA (cytidine(1402)-2'-O)-methyltransferase [Sedimentisphaerales bacterium]HNY77579.1 16S rRNA (cytidine(1402)-2'-O)-methyltransferase [Sedimentisphaerales bacterium]HOC61912.1 16S rRNA (cytidine(1402)-2'-O)-methyltransferase [Sedimentisphaerales bacterium]HOH63754.1 16S rRNA (cytidine(1402)-2'-O)-methyltransferase [Sedimentisphaerales bacterium]HPY51543.1 16S rRNA (cytidine(1402)-2'-O)-methyltransferase [Sedimentisphaerales bacterium]